MRKTSEKGKQLIKSFEGLRLNTYLDSVGIPTIGYGHTGPDVKMGDSITQPRADELFTTDLKRFEVGVESLVKVNIEDEQFSALVSFSYNLGLGNLKKSTLLKLLNTGDYTGAANQFLVWNKAGGNVLAGLTKRRQAEKDLFLSGTKAKSKSELPEGPSESDIETMLKLVE